ncbi:MAG: rhodanese-like domain-containing protein [FCB group bacterium]|nr:rhodanese-like domain-containing protein [FCB group bacterium]
MSKIGQDTSSVTVTTLKNIVDSGKDIFLLDVRTMPEYKQAHLSFADLMIPYDSLQFNLSRLPQDKNTEMYIFCRSGRRSRIATDYLYSIGYTRIHNILGGIIAWKKAGYPVVSGK